MLTRVSQLDDSLSPWTIRFPISPEMTTLFSSQFTVIEPSPMSMRPPSMMMSSIS
ncbi:hypothetical protein STSO111631_09660 [Stackebrandtia soli]